MTTITNFLQGNFIQQENLQQKQTPIWVLLQSKEQNSNKAITQIRNHMIQQFTTYKKQNLHNIIYRPLLHIDLGMNTLKTVRQATLVKQFEVPFYKMNNIGDNYYVMRLSAKQRAKQNSLTTIINIANGLHSSQFMKSQKSQNKLPQKMKNSMGLLIQGLQLMTSLHNFSNKLQSFIGALTNLSKTYKQITILIFLPSLLSQEHRFVLERISTCLTVLHQQEQLQQNNKWTCSSTVRRYTGFCKQQKYTIKWEQGMKNRSGKMKVEKYQKQKKQQESQEQKEMVAGLGFGVKKTQQEVRSTIKQNEALKKNIYPHLRIQEQLKKYNKKPMCPNCQGQHCHGCDADDDLIILDDQQEDDDDIDV